VLPLFFIAPTSPHEMRLVRDVALLDIWLRLDGDYLSANLIFTKSHRGSDTREVHSTGSYG
jgi:hypothetical protein